MKYSVRLLREFMDVPYVRSDDMLKGTKDNIIIQVEPMGVPSSFSLIGRVALL